MFNLDTFRYYNYYEMHLELMDVETYKFMKFESLLKIFCKLILIQLETYSHHQEFFIITYFNIKRHYELDKSLL